jgi:hypothetical protein
MKIRIFRNMDDGVFRVVLNTEDWSQGDIELMKQFGEPEIDVGGDISYMVGGDSRVITIGSQLVRVLHGFPYARGFDTRDFDGSVEEAMALGVAWKEHVVMALEDAVHTLRSRRESLPTEEIVDNV